MSCKFNENVNNHTCIYICTYIPDHRDLDQLEGRLKAKFVTSSKMSKFLNPFCHILETLDKNFQKSVYLWGSKVMYCYVMKSSNL
jgi:hypothetical protein